MPNLRQGQSVTANVLRHRNGGAQVYLPQDVVRYLGVRGGDGIRIEICEGGVAIYPILRTDGERACASTNTRMARQSVAATTTAAATTAQPGATPDLAAVRSEVATEVVRYRRIPRSRG